MTTNEIIVEIKPYAGSGGNLHAFADTTLRTPLGDITIFGCRVLCPPDGEPWVGFPSTSYEKNGKKHFKDILEFSRGLKKQIADTILAEYHRVKAAS